MYYSYSSCINNQILLDWKIVVYNILNELFLNQVMKFYAVVAIAIFWNPGPSSLYT